MSTSTCATFSLIIISATKCALSQGLQTTVRWTNAAREAIASGPRKHFVNNEKIIYCIYEKLVD